MALRSDTQPPPPDAGHASETVAPRIIFIAAAAAPRRVPVRLRLLGDQWRGHRHPEPVRRGEIFPNRIRAVALSVAASAQWLANWLITVSFPSLSSWSLAGAYSLYAMAATLSVPFVYYFVRETKGRTLESMG